MHPLVKPSGPGFGTHLTDRSPSQALKPTETGNVQSCKTDLVPLSSYLPVLQVALLVQMLSKQELHALYTQLRLKPVISKRLRAALGRSNHRL